MEIRLELTCEACPEQYDAFHGERLVGYFRLRHGRFYVDYYPQEGSTRREIYVAYPKGDGLFEPEERDGFLASGKQAIIDEMAKDALRDK